MINSKQYVILKYIRDNPNQLLTDLISMFAQDQIGKEAIALLSKLRYIKEADSDSDVIKCRITIDGLTAIEDYEYRMRSEEREQKNLKIAFKANIIARVAIAISLVAIFLQAAALVQNNRQGQQSNYQSGYGQYL